MTVHHCFKLHHDTLIHTKHHTGFIRHPTNREALLLTRMSQDRDKVVQLLYGTAGVCQSHNTSHTRDYWRRRITPIFLRAKPRASRRARAKPRHTEWMDEPFKFGKNHKKKRKRSWSPMAKIILLGAVLLGATTEVRTPTYTATTESEVLPTPTPPTSTNVTNCGRKKKRKSRSIQTSYEKKRSQARKKRTQWTACWMAAFDNHCAECSTSTSILAELEGQEMCLVCQNALSAGSTHVVHCDCSHEFHLTCIQTHRALTLQRDVDITPTCPACRAPINTVTRSDNNEIIQAPQPPPSMSLFASMHVVDIIVCICIFTCMCIYDRTQLKHRQPQTLKP